MQLEITNDECDELVRVLKERLGELREEVYHADVSTYHDQLKEREARMKALLAKLEGAA